MIYRVIDNKMKRWVVLIHCVCGNEKIFESQMDVLNSMYNIIIVRLAGHEINSKLCEASIDYEVQEIYNYVYKKNIKVDIIGVSLGAMIASRFCEKYSNFVNNVYLIGAIYGFSFWIFKISYTILMKVKTLIPRNIYMFLITYLILPSKTEKKQRQKLFKGSLKLKKKILYSWMDEMGCFILNGKKNLEQLLKNKPDIKFIYGEEDNIFLKFSKKYLPKDNIYIIPHEGHLCNINGSKIVNDIIRGG